MGEDVLGGEFDIFKYYNDVIILFLFLFIGFVLIVFWFEVLFCLYWDIFYYFVFLFVFIVFFYEGFYVFVVKFCGVDVGFGILVKYGMVMFYISFRIFLIVKKVRYVIVVFILIFIVVFLVLWFICFFFWVFLYIFNIVGMGGIF